VGTRTKPVAAAAADAFAVTAVHDGEKRHAVHLLQPAGTRVRDGRILKQYFEQNVTQQQLREELSLALTDDQVKRDDPLKPFSEVSRNELRALQNAL